MADMKRTAGIVFVILVALAIAVWYFLFSPDVPEAPPAPPPTEAPPSPTPTPGTQERLSERLKGVTLENADDAVRPLAGDLSDRPELAVWLGEEDLLRRAVAAVHNVAAGGSPVAHLEFLRPTERFKVREEDGVVTIDRSSWQRYDAVVAVFTSVDTERLVTLYRELEPLLQEAHDEISPPGETFKGRLVAAIDHLLEVPVPEDDEIEVRQKVVTYEYVDPELEGLSEAQRQLLRLGPRNVRQVQAKLRDVRAALTAAPTPTPFAVPAQ